MKARKMPNTTVQIDQALINSFGLARRANSARAMSRLVSVVRTDCIFDLQYQVSGSSIQSGPGRLSISSGALARKYAAQSVVTKNIVMEQGRKSVQANQEVTHGSHCFVNLLYLLGKILVLRSKCG